MIAVSSQAVARKYTGTLDVNVAPAHAQFGRDEEHAQPLVSKAWKGRRETQKDYRLTRRGPKTEGGHRAVDIGNIVFRPSAEDEHVLRVVDRLRCRSAEFAVELQGQDLPLVASTQLAGHCSPLCEPPRSIHGVHLSAELTTRCHKRGTRMPSYIFLAILSEASVICGGACAQIESPRPFQPRILLKHCLNYPHPHS